MGCIMTILEDNTSLVISLLEIYNVVDSHMNIKSLYPMGSKLAIMDPISSESEMVSFAILIKNHTNIKMHVTQKDKCTNSMPHVSAYELRKKGNIFFTEK